MYSFSKIKQAVLSVKERPHQFPFYGSISSEQLKLLRESSHMQPLFDEIRHEALRASTIEIPNLPFSAFHLFEAAGDRKEFERLYFDRRRRLAALVTAAVIDESDEFMKSIEDHIWEICNEFTWCLPAHLPFGVEACKADRLPPEQIIDLFAAETAHTLAETLELLKDRLNPWIGYRIRKEVEHRVFQPYFHSPIHFPWEAARMNWSAVCAGSAGMAALLLEDDRHRLTGIIDRVMRAMECFLEGYGDDGGCPEGIGYWTYGFGYYVYFAEMLYDFTNGAIDLLQSEKVERIAEFPAKISLSGNCFVNYSDSALRFYLQTGLMSRIALRFGQEMPGMEAMTAFHEVNGYRFAHMSRNIFWTDPSLFNRSAAEGTVYFPDLSWVVDRRYDSDVQIAFSAKGGHNAEPHNHNDLGHFILHAGGENLLADLGSGKYSREYFGPKRYSFIQTSSEGHSVPVLNGAPQTAGRKRQARVVHHEQRADGVSFELDLTKAYNIEELQTFNRSFHWTYQEADRTGTLELTDRFDFHENPDSIEEVFISLCPPHVADGNVMWQGKLGRVVMEYDPKRFEAQVEEITGQAFNSIGRMEDKSNPDADSAVVIYRLRMRLMDPKIQDTCQFSFTVERNNRS
jgi:hypothetical protein